MWKVLTEYTAHFIRTLNDKLHKYRNIFGFKMKVTAFGVYTRHDLIAAMLL